MKRKFFKFIPENIKKPIRLTIGKLKELWAPMFYLGNGRWCPVCEKSSKKFREFGVIPREDAQCVFCGALERHRFVWLYFSRMTDLFNKAKKTMLHIAPEKCFESRLGKRLGQGYITADLTDSHAMVQMDITDIHYQNEYFDVIYCSHVFEHISDDKKAISELYRVLKQDGWAILIVPITIEKTFEDPSIIDPMERLKIFGQHDHVRRYGPDYIDRLHEAGFKVKISHVSDIVEDKNITRMGLKPASGSIYYCTKI